MKTTITLCVLLIALLIGQPASAKKKPNVVLIYVDDMGWTDLGCYGSDYYQTPHIDRLASEGVKFTNSYSACTVSSPSRASVVTGKYPAKLHLTDWIEGHKFPWAKLSVPDWKMYLDSSETTIAETFKKAGYFTAHVGKWHLGDKEENWPDNHGFDINIGGWAKGAPHKSNKGYNGYFSPYGNPRLEDGKEGEYLTERLTLEVCQLIEQKADEPFFINFWLYNVHTPLQAKQEKIEKYQLLQDTTMHHHNPIYAAMVEHTDDAVGAIVNKLKEKGLYENTIILFSSDNGGLIGSGNQKVTSNYPLRDGKGSIYEGGVRVPTILYSPFHNWEKKVSDEPVISADYYPTLVDLANICIPKDQEKLFDGISWLPFLENHNEHSREALFWHYPHYHQQGAEPYSAIRMNNWKLIRKFETEKFELYDLNVDVGEEKNLANTYPEKVKAMDIKLEEWITSVEGQLPTLNPNYDPKRERNK